MHALRSANLCWGQRYHWFRYQLVPPGSRHEAHIADSLPLPEGLTLPHIRALLNQLALRHEVMRTVYDAEALPWPKQRVLPPGALPLHVATTERDGTATPAQIVRELVETDFDLARDWPVRACVVTTGGLPKRLMLVFNHLAFDDRSLEVLRRELEAMLDALRSGAPAALGPVAEQPVDVARRESAIRPSQVEEALRPWRAELERRNADVFASRRRRSLRAAVAPLETPSDSQSEAPSSFSASLTSPVLLECARSIAERLRVWPAAVHLAAYAVTVAAYTGEELISSRIYVSQRETSDLADLMTCMSFPALVTVEAGGDPGFAELVRRAAAGIEQAVARARVPYDRIIELTAQEETRRGRRLYVGSELNFLSNAPRSCGTPRERFAWNAEPIHWAKSGSDTYFRIYEWSDGLTLALQASAAVMDRAAVESFLRGYARLLEVHLDHDINLALAEAVRLVDFAPADPRSHGVVRADAVADHVGLDDGPDGTAPTTAGLAAGPAEQVLVEAVAHVNVLDQVNPADCYTVAGGRALRTARVLSRLEDLGWSGVSMDDLCGSRPLAALAARMRRSQSPDRSNPPRPKTRSLSIASGSPEGIPR